MTHTGGKPELGVCVCVCSLKYMCIIICQSNNYSMLRMSNSPIQSEQPNRGYPDMIKRRKEFSKSSILCYYTYVYYYDTAVYI